MASHGVYFLDASANISKQRIYLSDDVRRNYRVRNFGPGTVEVEREGGIKADIHPGISVDTHARLIEVNLKTGRVATGTYEEVGDD